MSRPLTACDETPLDRAGGVSARVAAEFRRTDAYRALERRFSGLMEDDPESAAVAATGLLCEDAWIGALIAPLADTLAEEPFFQPPFRVNRDAIRIGAVLFESPAVSITATVLSADALAKLPPARSVVLPGRLGVTRYVRGGGARLRLWSAEPAGSSFDASNAAPCVALGDVSLSDGMVLRLDGRVRGHLVESAVADVVMLTATIRAGASPFMREYDISSGRLMRTAMLDDRAARTEMLLAYLRLAGRADAGDCFEAATRDDAFFLRWAAMREWLALDAPAALPRLRDMAAQDPNREVRDAACITLPMAELLVAERCRG